MLLLVDGFSTLKGNCRVSLQVDWLILGFGGGGQVGGKTYTKKDIVLLCFVHVFPTLHCTCYSYMLISTLD